MSSFDEYRKKMNGKYGVKEEEKEKEEKEEENKPSPSSDSGSDSSSKFESYRSKMESKYNPAKDVDERYIESFLSDAKKFVNDAVSVNARMGYGTSTNLYNDRKKTADDLRSRGWNISKYLQQNKGNIPDEYYKSLSDYLDSFSKYTSQSMHSMYRSDQFYSQWETAEDYNFWESRNTAEKRQNLYAQQEQRLKELKAEKENLQKQMNRTTVSYPGYGASSNVGYPGYGASSKIHEAASQENIKKLGAIDDEIASIEMEMANYERGNYNDRGQHYGSKVVDDYSAYTKESDFDTVSANRAFANPTKDDLINYDVMSDSSTWYFDADGTYRDAFGNELKVDESGNWVNPAAGDYPVVDRLGMFLSASESDKVEASATTAGTEGVWANVLKDGIDGDWNQLEKGEISIYYYLLNSQGQQAADKYLSDMKRELNRRGMEKYVSNLSKAFDEADTLERIALSLATTPAQFVSGATGFIEDTINVLSGNDINPYSAAHSGTAFSTTVRNEQAKAWDEATGGIAIPFIDFSVGDLYQAGMSALDMLAGSKLGSGAYEVLMGMGSASSEAKRLYEQGASTEQITWGSALAGGAEILFEHMSIESLINLKDAKTVGQFVKNALIQGGIEATEEGFTEIANTITNAIVMGDESDWARLLEKHDGDYLGALIEKAQEVGNVAFSGFVSGGMGGSAHSVAPYAQNKAKMRSSGKDIMGIYGGVDSLLQLANDMAGVSEKMQRSITNQAGKVAKKATAGRVGLLNDMVQTANNQANASDIAKSLEENGFSAKSAKSIAEALVANSSGQRLTDAQEKLLESVKTDSRLHSALQRLEANTESEYSQRNQKTQNFAADIAIGMVKKALASEASEKEFTPEGKYEVSDSKKAIRTDTHEEIDIKGVASVSKGKLMLELADGQTIDVKSVSFANEADALIYEAVAKLGDNIDADTATALISKYNGGDAMVFARGMAQAYTWGFHGFDKAELLSESKLTSELTPEQLNTAYGLGEKYRPVKDAKDRDKARSTKAPAEKGVYYRDKDGNATDIETYMKENGKNLNTRQKTAIEVMRKFSNMMGARFHVFESWVKNGKNYYLDENGEVVEGNPNGFYDTTTGEIYIALDAGAIEANGFRDTMLFTIAHEMTHFMRQWSPEHFTKISKIIFQQAGFKGHMSELVAVKQANAKAKGKPISYDTAVEEVVADGMETILKDGKVVEFMAEVKQKDHGAWQKLKGWFKNLEKFLRKLMTAYRYETANTIEGDMVANFADDLIRQVQQIWAEGAVAAGENYQAVDGYKAEQEQMSTDTMRGSADGAVVQSKVTEAIVESKKQIRTEYEALPKQVMNLSDGAGTILDFIEGLTPTKVNGLSGKSINGYTGRTVRAYAMGISGFTQAQVNRVNKFMDTMAEFMEEAGVTYKFIGLQDVHDAKLHYTYNADGSIKSIVLSAMVKNGDYPVNFDLSSICKKRVAMSKLIDKLAKRGSLDNGTVKLTPANIFKINTALKDAGYETACLGCFVESKRYNSLEWAKKFCNKWNAAVKKVNPNATYFGYGDDSFSDDSFTLEQAVKIDNAANKYIKAAKTERLANALVKYKAKEQAGQPLVESFSKAARDRLIKSETISEELKTKYLNCDPKTLNIADVEFLLENGILPGAALSNKQAVTEMVKSGEAYQHLLRPSDLLTDRGISKLEALPNFHGVLYGHYGSGTPKLMQSYTPYNSEIALLPAKKGDLSLAEYLYSIAGVRMQSFSDFQIQNIYDYLQMVGDLAARKVPAHAYTKELPFAKLLGMTGIKVNLSVMFDIDPMVDKAHAGLTKLNKLVHRGEYAKVVLEDAQGKWVYNIGDYQTQKLFAEAYPDQAKRFLQSIGFGDAVKLQSSPGYSANCGIIGVGYSDLGIFAMLNDNRIRYIIPYHASSLPAEIKLATNIALGTDYTPYQNNMKIKEIVDRNGNKVNWTIKEAYKRLGSGQAVINELNEKIRTEGWVVSTSKAQTGHGSYGLYEDLQQTNDPRQTASNFMDWCIGNSTLPLFYQFASHENYYKLLYDYNVYDCVTEEYAPQQAVTNTYPTMVDGQVQPGNVTDGGFDAEYFKGAIDKQMAFMDAYSRNLDEDLDALAENMENGTLFSDRQASTQGDLVRFSQRTFNKLVDDIVYSDDNAPFDYRVVYMGETPQVLLDIGFIQLPMTITSKHIYTVANKEGRFTSPNDHYHELGATRVKELPEMVREAVVTFVEKENPKRVVIVTSKVDPYGQPIMVAVEYSGQTNYNEVRIFANPVTTALGKKENWFLTQITEAIEDGRLLQADKKRSQESPSGLWAQCPEGLWSSDFTTNIEQFKRNVKRFLPKEKQIRKSWAAVRESEETSKKSDRDSTYLDAVNRGDMETAQRMVDEAAKAAGYTIKVYHGTPNTNTEKNPNWADAVVEIHSIVLPDAPALIPYSKNFYAFDNLLRYRFGKIRPELRKKIPYGKLMIARQGPLRNFTAFSRDYAGTSTKAKDAMDGFFVTEDKTFAATFMATYAYDTMLGDVQKTSYGDGALYELYLRPDATTEYRETTRRSGGKVIEIVVKSAEQLKSADPVTYDDDGNVIPLSQRFNTEKDDIRYSDRDTESVSNRSLLANAFEGIAKPEEQKKVQEYKGKIALINAEEQKLRELNAQIKELSFAKGPKDTKKLKELRFDANQAANRINTYDKQLLRLEASQPLQDVLAREKKRAYAKAEQRGREALAEYKAKAEANQKETVEKWRESRKKAVESRKKTAMRHKIQSVVKELNDLLLNESKKRHVPDNLKKAVADALALVNMDTVGAEERAAKYAAMIAKETDPDKIDAYTVTMENILRQGEKMGQRLKELRDAYEEISESDDPDIANAYDPVIAGCLKELSQSIGNTSLRNMTIEQLSDVYDMYKMVLTRVRDANKSLIESIKESIANRASRVVGEIRRVGGEHKYRAAILDPVRKFLWNNLKPVYAFEHLGSATLTEAFNGVRKGEDTWATDVTEARGYYLDKSKKYGYDSWDFKKKYRFTSASDLEFELTLEQILSLYAYSKREQAHDHLRLGGFVFDSNIETYKEDGGKLKYKVNTADAHQLTPEILANIIGTLTSEQMAFVDEMQEYLSTVMGAKGNEVTMKMYGVKLFKEKFYFPLKSAKQFMFEQNEVSGEVKIKNSGFTNKVVAKANNPVILSNFMDVWANHVNDMSMYHSFVLPLEDFNRIFNYNSPKKETRPSVSVKGTIQSAYSPAAVNYVKQLITDLNGGAVADPRETIGKTLMSKFKKAKVFSSLSVVIQQPSALGRAFALVNPRYFHTTKDGMKHDELWAELKKYAPVAIIKEMGYFDTNMGRSAVDFIKAKEYTTFKEKAKALFTDGEYRDELLSKGPALADELTWCAIWNAVKRETKEKHTGLDIKSEPFLMLAGARFTEVITKTQVYDSILARSANMRSKTGMMSMVTAFMAEPTTSINMLEDALRKSKRGYKGLAARAFASVAASVILNNALVALVYGMRDDDEDETFAEKYMQAFVSGMLDDVNPVTYYPFLKDLWSVLQGYDVERSDMSLVSDLADAMKRMVKAYTSEDGDVAGAWWDMAGAVANIGGIPMQNIRRDVNGAINFFNTLSEDVNGRTTTWGSMGDALEVALRDTLPVVGWLPGESKADKLYDAIMSDDETYVNRLKGSYKDENAYHNAMRTAIKERYEAGDIDSETAISYLIEYAGMEDSDAYWKVEEWEYESESGEDFGKYNEFFTAVETGKNLRNIIKQYTNNGVKPETLATQITSHFKPIYGEMTASQRAKLKGYLLNAFELCGMDREKASDKIAEWQFETDHPELVNRITFTQYKKWETNGKPNGVSVELFAEVAEFRDEDGSSKSQEEVADYINSLPISTSQKDALWYCFWKESTLDKAPWH